MWPFKRREPIYTIDIRENLYRDSDSVWEWLVDRDWHILDLGAEPTELAALERCQAAIEFDVEARKAKHYQRKVRA